MMHLGNRWKASVKQLADFWRRPSYADSEKKKKKKKKRKKKKKEEKKEEKKQKNN